jgi:hypothetical protein
MLLATRTSVFRIGNDIAISFTLSFFYCAFINNVEIVSNRIEKCFGRTKIAPNPHRRGVHKQGFRGDFLLVRMGAIKIIVMGVGKFTILDSVANFSVHNLLIFVH